jgi:hypothetical protein
MNRKSAFTIVNRKSAFSLLILLLICFSINYQEKADLRLIIRKSDFQLNNRKSGFSIS